jgi:hypothetical protein
MIKQILFDKKTEFFQKCLLPHQKKHKPGHDKL